MASRGGATPKKGLEIAPGLTVTVKPGRRVGTCRGRPAVEQFEAVTEELT
jgi:hypothetical protein